jgi:thiazole synthase ThiGH ThiG subunit
MLQSYGIRSDAAVLVNTAIAAGNPKLMAEAFRKQLLLVEKHTKRD